MIHYHGGPITPVESAVRVWTARHAMISFAHPGQLPIAAEVCQSFVLDNGAFSEWRGSGDRVDSEAFAEWVREWWRHPAFDWCVIPDVIDGNERDNDAMIEAWGLPAWCSVPVWHLHESIERLVRLAKTFPRVALGSSGQWGTPGTPDWWERMNAAMREVCDEHGRPICKLHGLRMMNPTIFSALPLSSADSCGVARNLGLDAAWDKPGQYLSGLSKSLRGLILAERYERHAAASTWAPRTEQMSFELLG